MIGFLLYFLPCIFFVDKVAPCDRSLEISGCSQEIFYSVFVFLYFFPLLPLSGVGDLLFLVLFFLFFFFFFLF